jgi:uncharacterized protein YukE
MAGMIKVNTEQVAAIASSIESLNGQLKDLLLESNSLMQRLGDSWTGEAATKTIENYNGFARTFSDQYYQVIDQYVKFLRVNVSSGYFETETANISLADSFK